MSVDLISWPMANAGALFLLLVAVLWLRYTIGPGCNIPNGKSGGAKGVPSIFPCVFPLLGSLPIMYLLKPRDFVLDPK